VESEFDGKRGWIVLDQIRTVDKSRLVKKVGKLQKKEIVRVKAVLKEMLID
jgi:mRNA interferase MazF